MAPYETHAPHGSLEAPRAPAPPDAEEISLVDLWRVLWRQKWVVIGVTAVATAAAIVIAVTTPPVYRAEVLLAPAVSEGGAGPSRIAAQFGGLAQLAGVDLGGGSGVSATDQAIAILRSRSFTERFLRQEGVLPVLFADREEGGEPPTMWDAYKKFDRIRQVAKEKETGLVRVAVEWTDPARAAEWANTLVQRLNAENRLRSIAEADANLRYLNEQLEKSTNLEMRGLLYNLIQSEMSKVMVANSKEEYSFRVIDPAVVPQDKVRPQRALIAGMGLLLGLTLGVFLAFFRNFLQKA